MLLRPMQNAFRLSNLASNRTKGDLLTAVFPPLRRTTNSNAICVLCSTYWVSLSQRLSHLLTLPLAKRTWSLDKPARSVPAAAQQLVVAILVLFLVRHAGTA